MVWYVPLADGTCDLKVDCYYYGRVKISIGTHIMSPYSLRLSASPASRLRLCFVSKTFRLLADSN